MIKVIKDGVLPEKKNPTYQLTCDNCGCVFECNYDDLTLLSGGVYEYVASVDCPCCKNYVHTAVNVKTKTLVEDK